METIVKFDGWNNIEWDGAGKYVAKTLRGPTTFKKVPFGMKPVQNGQVIIKDFINKPEIKSSVLSSTNGLWEPV